MEHSFELHLEIWKIGRCRSRSLDNAKLGHFTLLFCRGRKEIYKDLSRTCTAIVLLIKLFFGDVPVAVSVMVFLNSPFRAQSHRTKLNRTFRGLALPDKKFRLVLAYSSLAGYKTNINCLFHNVCSSLLSRLLERWSDGKTLFVIISPTSLPPLERMEPKRNLKNSSNLKHSSVAPGM